MANALVIRVLFHDGRYHGVGDWPPSPARLFQALVAAAGLNGQLASATESLKWLESRPSAPIIAAPNARRGQRVMFYMPNNDLDAVKADPRRVAKIRTARKLYSPWLFDATTPFLYSWPGLWHEDEPHAQRVILLADRIYQLGRGVDMAWAWGELLDATDADELLGTYPGSVYRPGAGEHGIRLLCPQPNSLESITARYQAYGQRFRTERQGKRLQITFRKPPRPNFRSLAYDSQSLKCVYELRQQSSDSAFAPWPLVDVSKLVVCLRDGAVKRLETAMPARKAEIARLLVGRKPDGTNDGPVTQRIRIIPLPSIGHPNADRAIRRIVVEVPAGCSLHVDDVAWAFSGLEPIDLGTGEVYPVVLIPAPSDDMLRHFGIEDNGARTWRTVTPLVLPEAARRRRIDRSRRTAEAKGSTERSLEQRSAGAALLQALRHADVRERVQSMRVQREPFETGGERVEAFAAGTRFSKQRLWHVEITFADPVSGPLVIGDGRFLGLGVMAPCRSVQSVRLFSVDGLAENPDPIGVAKSLRRAVMARVQNTIGPSQVLSSFFSGHDSDGEPARSDRHPHLAFAFDARDSRLLIIAPHGLDHRAATYEERRELDILDDALRGFNELRAGSAGTLSIGAVSTNICTDSLFAPSRTWESATPYQVTRHARASDAEEALAMDLRAECRRRGLPDPIDVRVLAAHGVPGLGLTGRVSIAFAVAVRGPVLLGRSRFLGGGLFRGISREIL